MFVHFTLRDAWMSKKGLFRTLKGSLVLSICPVFIFSIRGEMISFSMHNSRVLKLHWPTGCPWKNNQTKKHTKIKDSHLSTPTYLIMYENYACILLSCQFTTKETLFISNLFKQRADVRDFLRKWYSQYEQVGHYTTVIETHVHLYILMYTSVGVEMIRRFVKWKKWKNIKGSWQPFCHWSINHFCQFYSEKN